MRGGSHCTVLYFPSCQLDVNTVAAGGGSRLFFRSGMFVVGPESAGAHPGLSVVTDKSVVQADN